MGLSRHEILAVLEGQAEALRSFDVRRLALFGSAARNEWTEGSDLDFLVDFERKSFDAYIDLKEHLEQLFGCRVDLVTEDAIKPRLRPYIMAGAVRVPGF